ncbi:hypothetical protein STEG23_002935 [Scotinomys teguina]
MAAESRKRAVALIPPPTNARQLREFLGSAGFCRLWILGFAEMTAPLYPLTKAAALFAWGQEQQQAFDKIKHALLSAPALSLPDTTKSFTLYIDERKHIAKGVLIQKLGPWKRPVAYFSKKLDNVVASWPPCLRMIAAVATLVKDSDKFTLGQPLTVATPHAIETVIRQPPDRWGSQMPESPTIRNTPNAFELTPYEIVYGGPPPMADLLGPGIDSYATSSSLQARLRVLQLIQNQIWKPLAEVYQSKAPVVAHPFQIGDSVYVHRHQSRTLEPHWKGPYTVLLTTPTGLKATPIHL